MVLGYVNGRSWAYYFKITNERREMLSGLIEGTKYYELNFGPNTDVALIYDALKRNEYSTEGLSSEEKKKLKELRELEKLYLEAKTSMDSIRILTENNL
jgi:hypothetical protein